MNREKDKRTKLGVIYTIIIIVVVCFSIFSIYQQHKNNLKVHHSTFAIPKLPDLTGSQIQSLSSVEGAPVPKLDADYTLMFQSPNDSGVPPEVDYLTTDSSSQIVAYAQQVCGTYNMATKKTRTGYDIISPTVSYEVTTVQCYDKNSSWSFDIEPAIALSTPEYNGPGTLQSTNEINGQVPKSALSSNLNSEQWVKLRPLGPPVTNCNDNHVCYIQKSSLVNGS